MSGVVFDPSRAKVDAAYRTEAMELYKQGKLEISDKDLKWLKEILGVSEDDNEYEIDDPKSNAPSTGKKVSVAGDLAVSAGTFAAGEIIKKTAVNKAMKKGGEEAASSLLGQKADKIMARDNSIGQILECFVAFAVGTKYMLSRPNKSEHHELNKLKDVMETGNLELINGQSQIEESTENVEDIKVTIDGITEDADKSIEELQKELEEKQARLEVLEQKVQNGEELTEEEKAEYEALGGEDGEIAQLLAQIEELQAGKIDDIDDTKDGIEDEQEVIENVDGIFHSVEEVADYAETFDTATQTLSVVEAAAQGLNAAMGIKAALELSQKHPMLSLTTFGQVARGMAVAGAGMSTFGAAEQIKYSIDIGNEIDVRKDVQDTGVEVVDEIDTENEIIEDITNPDDVPPEEPPEDPPVVPEPLLESEPNPDDDDKKDQPEE